MRTYCQIAILCLVIGSTVQAFQPSDGGGLSEAEAERLAGEVDKS